MTSPPFRLNNTITAAFHPMAEAHEFSRPFFITRSMLMSRDVRAIFSGNKFSELLCLRKRDRLCIRDAVGNFHHPVIVEYQHAPLRKSVKRSRRSQLYPGLLCRNIFCFHFMKRSSRPVRLPPRCQKPAPYFSMCFSSSQSPSPCMTGNRRRWHNNKRKIFR